MSADTVDQKNRDITLNDSAALPQFPGEEFLAHAGSQWKEKAENRLIAAGLLEVARGGIPASLAKIVDIDLSALPYACRRLSRWCR